MATFVKAKEVARECNLAESTVFYLAAQNRIPHVRFGRRAIRFPLEEVQKWAENQIQRPVEQAS